MITALEEILIKRYYGLQIARFDDYYTFIGDLSVSSSTRKVTGGVKRYAKSSGGAIMYTRTAIIRGEYNDGRAIDVFMDNIALGKESFSDGMGYAQKAVYGTDCKAYFTLVNNTNPIIVAPSGSDGQLYWQGYYKFHNI